MAGFSATQGRTLVVNSNACVSTATLSGLSACQSLRGGCIKAQKFSSKLKLSKSNTSTSCPVLRILDAASEFQPQTSRSNLNEIFSELLKTFSVVPCLLRNSWRLKMVSRGDFLRPLLCVVTKTLLYRGVVSHRSCQIGIHLAANRSVYPSITPRRMSGVKP
jgi:hypothetical protein